MIKIISIGKKSGLLIAAMITAMAGIPPSVGLAANSELTDDSCEAIEAIGGECGKSEGAIGDLLQRIVNALLFLIGAVSVVMIIIGGIRFILSRGDPQAAVSARNTVMYAVVGVVVAVLAWAIVSWVLGEIYGTSQMTTPTPTPVDTGGGPPEGPL